MAARRSAPLRWPGFRCPRCACGDFCRVRHESRLLFQCQSCRHQTSLKSGTVFASSKLALRVWFLAIHLISQAKTGLSALALKRHLGGGGELQDGVVGA